ncbi:unnamed protein product [Fusarium equiseti]|uniref:Ankyrin n=1 Tax=Fusarium equiseti TaxID=61235 RepID=A0A8J2IGB7_FUSEQ|nr:unnamed protein product [Fusarium equiseti]
MYAAEAGDISTLVELLTDGYDISDLNARDYNGCTPLALAAEKGHTAVVKRLLEHDANPNLSDLDHITPLWKAARYGHTSVVELLLASTKLLDVNTRPAYLHKSNFDTPLSIALKEGHQEIAELLSRTNGINPSLTTNLPNGYDRAIISILGLAIHCAFEDVALFLLHICDLRHDVQHDSDDGTHDDNGAKDRIEPPSKLLVLAVAAGCSCVIEELLTKHGADINGAHEYFAREERRWFTDSPLIAASRRGGLNTVCSLLNMDEIRPGVSSKGGDTALTAAARGGFRDVVKTLITDGRIDVNSKDGRDRTALSLAAESGCEGVINELLATGVADLNAQDDVGRTALIFATDPEAGYGPGGWQLYEGALRRLLADSQIAVNIRDGVFDRTALQYAAKNGALGLVKALLEHPQIDPTAGPGYTSPLAEAAENGHADVVRALLNRGQVDVNTVLTRAPARTGLMAAVENGRGETGSVIQVLISTVGVDVNFQDEFGETALMLAASRGTLEILKLILASGAGPKLFPLLCL